ncbi:MFS transporter [Frigoriglobus tundricola]|uniref:Putative MFS-type transporter n=1 Tax=Frigoriglobus tundricola TaxID=2774151 RepID=A0A6M5YWQ3_9BACT|nr:MFS transporter [Frigoriglobus tundricola]QJW97721.1 putative MFS-type transporter [Frigoriglobus tundricola]
MNTDDRRGLFAALRDTTFRSLRHRYYRRYFAGQVVSFVGTWMQSAALMWLMYDRTGDPRWPSWLLVAQVGPTLLFGAWGGALADRYPKRRLVSTTQSCFLLNAIVLTVVVASGLAVPWLVLVLMAVNGVVQAVDLPARLAFVPDLVPKEDLINAVGLNSLVFNSARAVGPALAGVLFLLANAVAPVLPAGTHAVTTGATACFALNALSFLAVLRALRGIPEPRANARTAGSMWDGLRYLRDRPQHGGLVALTFVVCVFAWPVVTVLPAYTRLRLGLREDAYSLLLSAMGAGALGAALATATFGSVARRGAFLLLGVGVCAAGLAGLGLADRAWAAGACCAAVGFGLILYLSTGQSVLQIAVPDEKRGRVMAWWAMTLSASTPLGHLLAGQAVTTFGVGPVLLGMGAGVGLVAVALAVLLVGLRRRDAVRVQRDDVRTAILKDRSS